jgi:hypothetical protein
MEDWRPINNYPNYFISSLGRVKRNNKIRKQSLARGYLQLSLCKNGILENFRIHQLVANHFLPNWNNYKMIDHLNRDKLDNRVVNLRWCNGSINSINKGKRSNCSSKYKGVFFCNSRNKWTACIRRNGKCKTIGRFETEDDALLELNRYIRDNNLEWFEI